MRRTHAAALGPAGAQPLALAKAPELDEPTRLTSWSTCLGGTLSGNMRDVRGHRTVLSRIRNIVRDAALRRLPLAEQRLAAEHRLVRRRRCQAKRRRKRKRLRKAAARVKADAAVGGVVGGDADASGQQQPADANRGAGMSQAPSCEGSHGAVSATKPG